MAGFRTSELVELGACAVCGRKQLEGLQPVFYVVSISRVMFDLAAVRRAAGAEMTMGALAQVLGPDEVLAKTIEEPVRVFVHAECSLEVVLGGLMERPPKGEPDDRG